MNAVFDPHRQRLYELALPPALALVGDAGPTAARRPGTVIRDGARSSILHFAPGRWLLVGAAVDEQSDAVAAVRALGGVALDVSAKWVRIEIAGPGALALLETCVELQDVLAGRDCAATTAFGCPVLLARTDAGHEFWVPRSLHAAFSVILHEADAQLAARPGD